MNDNNNDSEQGQGKKGFSLPEFYRQLYDECLMEIQKENPTIMKAFVGLQGMFSHTLRALCVTFDNELNNLETEILEQADKIANEKGFSEYEREEMKRNFRVEFDQHKRISERHSALIWATEARVQRIEDQENDETQ